MTVEPQPLIQVFQYSAAFLFVCFLPGFALSFLLFPPPGLDIVERSFLSFFSSIAISSLIASCLLLQPGRFTPTIFFGWIILLVLIFSGFALRSKLKGAVGLTPLSLRSALGNTCSLKSILAVAGLTVIFLVLLQVVNSGTKPIPDGDQLPTSPSGITEFYILPQELEKVLENPNNISSEIRIPIEIVNHHPEPVVYKITVLNEENIAYERAGITISPGDTWHGDVAVPRLNFNPLPYYDLLLFAGTSQNPVAQLRLWY